MMNMCPIYTNCYATEHNSFINGFESCTHTTHLLSIKQESEILYGWMFIIAK